MPTPKSYEKTHHASTGQSYHFIMLNRPQNRPSRATDHTFFSPPPLSPPTSHGTHTSIQMSNSTADTPQLNILQLNCFNKLDNTQELLQLTDVDILLLQEPWTNPFNYRIPTHHMWHDVTPYDHIPKDAQTKFRTCIYVARKHPSQHISILPSRSTYITALELTLEDTLIPKIRVMSCYN